MEVGGNTGGRTSRWAESLRAIVGDRVTVEPGLRGMERWTDGVCVVRPASDNQVDEIVRWAASEGVRILPLGSGSQWIPGLEEGESPVVLSTRELSGTVDYEPRDLVMVVRAGTPFEEVQRIAGEHGQWLPLDPLVGREATIGGVVSCASAGPHRLGYGPPRDWVIGLKAATPDGLVRMGGKVVKNVAGYDVAKLFVGARGTLGVITEVALKLRPLPPERWLLALTAEEPDQVASFARELLDRPWVTAAAEWLNPDLAAACELPGKWTLLLGCDESSEAARALVERWRELARQYRFGETGVWRDGEANEVWARYRHALNSAGAVRLRWVVWPAKAVETAVQAVRLWEAAASDQTAVGPEGAKRTAWLVSAGIGTGEIRAAWVWDQAPASPSLPEGIKRCVTALTGNIREDMGRVFVEGAPVPWARELYEATGVPAAIHLSQQLRKVMDPSGIFAAAGPMGGI
ncbi:MAG: FAD-binding oxidoreductase [Alicyclobacillaceae bacterium]|nr:FAD-binding oxidoreductase [Alicyclobacillaceae bacterium]